MAIKNTDTRNYLSIALIGLIALAPNFQQERFYTVNIPASKVNQFLMVTNGQLDQISAKDYKELTAIIEPQIYQQYRRYASEDSAAKTRQTHLSDSLKRKP